MQEAVSGAGTFGDEIRGPEEIRTSGPNSNMALVGELGGSILVRLQHKFSTRRSEWIAAVQLMLWGIAFMLPGALFDSRSFTGFEAFGWSENTWGTLFFLFGFARFSGLVINGAMVRTTSIIRAVSAGISFCLWAFVSFQFGSAAPWWEWSTWIAAWPVAAVAEFFNIRAAVYDTRIAHNGSTDR